MLKKSFMEEHKKEVAETLKRFVKDEANNLPSMQKNYNNKMSPSVATVGRGKDPKSGGLYV
jgi:hypothetical protein